MLIHPDTIDIPALRPYRTLRRQEEHRTAGIFVAEGEKVVRRLLASHLDVVSLLMTPAWAERLPAGSVAEHVKVYIVPESYLQTITGYRMHQGIMAVGRIPREPELEALIAGLPRPILLAAFDSIAHAENTGVMVRNCAAFGVQGILAGRTSCSPWLRRAVRNSMGGVFLLPVIQTSDLAAVLRHLHDVHAVASAVTDAHAGAPLDSVDLKRDICLVFGGEQSGVSEEVRKAAAYTIRIPMRAGVDSLNVSNACAVALYEVCRQRAATSAPHQPSETASPGNIGSTPNG